MHNEAVIPVEKCSECSHDWHGLPCSVKMGEYSIWGQVPTKQCECKGPFG